MKIPGYKDWSYTGPQIIRMIAAGRDIGSGKRGRKPSMVPIMNKLAKKAHREKQRLYDNLWGHWCMKHQVPHEHNIEGGVGHWRCPMCRKLTIKANRDKRRLDPAFRASEKKRYREWLKKRIASSPEAAAKYEAIDKRWDYKRRSLLEKNPLTAETVLAFWDTYDCCLKCGSVADLSIDHVVPLSKGGGSEFLNLQCLCRVCNSTKNDKDTDYRVRVISSC